MSSSTMPYAEFEAEARARGCSEVLERSWAPDTVIDTHTHSFSASALVVDGEMWLTVAGQTRHLVAGDRFELEAEVPHSERYGTAGARYFAARRASPNPG